jgi:ferritin
MISQKLTDQINDQIGFELYSAYIYLAMAAQCEATNLPGFANWFKAQAAEEQEHAMRFFDYVNEQGSRVILPAIDQPEAEYGDIEAMFATALEHEQLVSSRINKIYETALEEKDYASQIFLQWFITEQVEEEATASEILEMIKMTGKAQLALLDRHKMFLER